MFATNKSTISPVFASSTCFIKPSTSFKGKKINCFRGRSQHFLSLPWYSLGFLFSIFVVVAPLSENQAAIWAVNWMQKFFCLIFCCFHSPTSFSSIVFISSFTCWSSTRLPPQQRQTSGLVLHLLTCFPLFHFLPPHPPFFTLPQSLKSFYLLPLPLPTPSLSPSSPAVQTVRNQLGEIMRENSSVTLLIIIHSCN